MDENVDNLEINLTQVATHSLNEVEINSLSKNLGDFKIDSACKGAHVLTEETMVTRTFPSDGQLQVTGFDCRTQQLSSVGSLGTLGGRQWSSRTVLQTFSASAKLYKTDDTSLAIIEN